jgi:hypothetical protein
MATSRRDFLKKGTLVALAAGVPASLAEKVAGKASLTPAGFGLTKAAFEAQLNTEFLIGASRVSVKLVDVTDLDARKKHAPGKEGFSLLFRGDPSTPLRQDTYLIEHKSLGLFSFLIVPVMRKKKAAQYYEAVINRLHP